MAVGLGVWVQTVNLDNIYGLLDVLDVLFWYQQVTIDQLLQCCQYGLVVVFLHDYFLG